MWIRIIDLFRKILFTNKINFLKKIFLQINNIIYV